MGDIWDEFERIAVAQGLISVAEEDGPRPNVPRYDSLADDAIRLLYNIEPEPEATGKNIIEHAHPETAVVGRAYDAMNSIVENEQQRHDMMAYIALKMPNGHLTQRRYVEAKKELLNSLIRSAFTLDHQDEDGLMVLADSCAQRLEEREIKKEASPVIVAGVATAATLLGLAYYFFKGAPPAENVYKNAQKVIQALEPLVDQPYAAPIQTDMLGIMSMAKQVYQVKTQTAPIHSVDEAVSASQQADEKKKVEIAHQILTNYMTQLMKIKTAIPKWVAAISATAQEDTEERSEWDAKFDDLMRGMFSTTEKLLIYALEGKSDVMAKFKQFIPGVEQQGDKQGGLMESINVELANFSKAVGIAKESAPKISGKVEQKLESPAAIAPAPKYESAQIKAPPQKDKPIASSEPTQSPSMEDLNRELFNTMGLKAAASLINSAE